MPKVTKATKKTQPNLEAVGTRYYLEILTGQIDPFVQTAAKIVQHYHLELVASSKLFLRLKHVGTDEANFPPEGFAVSREVWETLYLPFVLESRLPQAADCGTGPAAKLGGTTTSSPEGKKGTTPVAGKTNGMAAPGGPPKGEHARIQISAIDIPAGANSRRVFEPALLLTLEQSMGDIGQIEAVIVLEEPSTGRFQYIAGERRIRAAIAAGETMIDAKVYRGLDRLTARKIHVATDHHRADIDQVARGRDYAGLIEEGMTVGQVATFCGVSDDVVRRCQKLLDLPQEVQSLIEAGDLSSRAAAPLLRILDAGCTSATRERRAERVIELAAQIARDGVGQAGAEALVTAELAADVPASLYQEEDQEEAQQDALQDAQEDATDAAGPNPLRAETLSPQIPNDSGNDSEDLDAGARKALGQTPLKNPPTSPQAKTRAARELQAKKDAEAAAAKTAAESAGGVFLKTDDDLLEKLLAGKGIPAKLVLSGRLKVEKKTRRIYLAGVVVAAAIGTDVQNLPSTVDRIDAVAGLDRLALIARKQAKKTSAK